MFVEVTHIARKLPDEPRVNEEITAAEVLVIDNDGTKLGVMTPAEGIAAAEERELDLVEVAPDGKPPVCRILDFGKYRYQQQKRDKDARKKQKVQALKEIKMRPKIDEHDYDFKTKAIIKFLEGGHRVKVSIFFRGREMAFLDKGREVIDRVAIDCAAAGKMDEEPRMEGRYMRALFVPLSGSSAKSDSKE
ncbi:MAG: translation initiation factor IF-3 [Pyramidobacter sp.]|nr:translation initiation factor IF-3 [Pyramidobacter sp.]MBP3752529.1 translation initiation factor IF-3 [Pyramidobacter sp.]MBQ4490617.1 translation initiation factor IF-3 [Pyramidobacter sp.]MBQ8091534.1 translation initiation factor IF-3 [Pyramidobacter sp.]MBQ9423095.1 translation initiation factor IF-3 [Pyramidobacter sp.]